MSTGQAGWTTDSPAIPTHELRSSEVLRFIGGPAMWISGLPQIRDGLSFVARRQSHFAMTGFPGGIATAARTARIQPVADIRQTPADCTADFHSGRNPPLVMMSLQSHSAEPRDRRQLTDVDQPQSIESLRGVSHAALRFLLPARLPQVDSVPSPAAIGRMPRAPLEQVAQPLVSPRASTSRVVPPDGQPPMSPSPEHRLAYSPPFRLQNGADFSRHLFGADDSDDLFRRVRAVEVTGLEPSVRGKVR